jgi:hypothetical protein
VGLKHDGICQEATKKGGAPWVSSPGSVLFVARDQVEGRTPKALALATACVRLWTPSLP